MAFDDLGSEGDQAGSDSGVLEIGAGDAVSEVEENFGDTAHADAADADEVYALDLREHEWMIVKDREESRVTVRV
jgi:hypothetical protein